MTIVRCDPVVTPIGHYGEGMVTDSKPTALITGASRGLGAAIARELAPTHRLLLGARSVDSLTEILAELPQATGWPVELTDYEAVALATGPIERLDVLVHNAGVAGDLGPIADSPVRLWRETLEANLIAVAELTRLLLPALRAAKGHVVLINSGAGLRANPGWGVYAASKFGLRAFGDALRLEESALRVTSIHPGRIDTDMQRAIVAGEGREYRPEEFLTAETVARAVRNAVETPRDAHPTEIVLRPIAR
ncbi:NADP-dependent 3-hydroxy acid dehydrogenase YdfG [Nocardia pseudobrasiliensis]|uniref:NADP-dependent 3-hydroxy acid dehydrogenase YdfG n=2 Tax=Nocardia pseudobrasiliensis TaxID=45979 RepID=A0A370HX93_9NOCA|nr:NADP-dependent 3-hydroxy acid dehydrogenase YdfG [Nocardia pseudobrasiliensis]